MPFFIILISCARYFNLARISPLLEYIRPSGTHHRYHLNPDLYKYEVLPISEIPTIKRLQLRRLATTM